jgi:hypothetical protein
VRSEELLALWRAEMRDLKKPYLWCDEEFYAYLDDAQTQFCIFTDGISDASTAAVVQLPVAVGDEWLDLHPSILKIRGVTRASDAREVEVLNYEDMPARGMRFDGRTGPVTTLIVGMEENKVRVYPKASVTDDLRLLVFRLPLTRITKARQTLEVSERHHLHLLSWVKARALLKEDAETFDKNKSVEMENTFRAYCAQAKADQATKRHKVRVVRYGGI